MQFTVGDLELAMLMFRFRSFTIAPLKTLADRLLLPFFPVSSFVISTTTRTSAMSPTGTSSTFLFVLRIATVILP